MFKKNAVGAQLEAVVRQGEQRANVRKAAEQVADQIRRQAEQNARQRNAAHQTEVNNLQGEVSFLRDALEANRMAQGRLEFLVWKALVNQDEDFLKAPKEALQRWVENDVRERMIARFGAQRTEQLLVSGLVDLDMRLDRE